MPRKPFVPTGLYRRQLIAVRMKRNRDHVQVGYEGETICVLYRPGDVGYDKWAALADEQAKEAKAA